MKIFIIATCTLIFITTIQAHAAALVVSDPIAQKSLSSSLSNDTKSIDATRDVEYQTSWIRTSLYGKHTFSKDISGDVKRYRRILSDVQNVLQKSEASITPSRTIPATQASAARALWQESQQHRRAVRAYSERLLEEAENSVDHLETLATRNDNATTIKQSQGMTNRLLLELLKQLQTQSVQMAVMQQLSIDEKPLTKISLAATKPAKSSEWKNANSYQKNCDNDVSRVFACEEQNLVEEKW